MVGELIMLPLRVGVRATQLWFRVAEETVSVAANATGRLIEVATRGSDGGGPAFADATERPASERDETSEPETSPETGAAESPTAAARAALSATPSVAETPGVEAPVEPEPSHVSEEPALVEQFAEPGAEDGAGAEIRVDEPWEGYAQMNARQVTARLNASTPAELAAVQLYEGTHRRRQTILNAVQRALRTPNGSSSRNQ